MTPGIRDQNEGNKQGLHEKAVKLDISANIIFTALYGQEKVAAYVDANLSVLPSVYESFPLTVLEAWTYGTPVIISESCALSATIDRQQAGIVVGRDSIKNSRSIHRLLIDDELREGMRANGRACVEGEDSMERVVEKIEEVYSAVTRNNYKNI